MPDYAFVKDETGATCGMWLRDSGLAQTRERLVMFVVKESLSMELYVNVLEGRYRVVPNALDDAGGCFVMLGQALAPGEKW